MNAHDHDLEIGDDLEILKTTRQACAAAIVDFLATDLAEYTYGE